MIFSPDLAAKVLDGTKTVTRRRQSTNPRSPWHRDRVTQTIGKDQAIVPGRGQHAIGRIHITSVELVRLGDITDADAVLEGCTSAEHFVSVWAAINGSYNDDEQVWRVAFEVISHG